MLIHIGYHRTGSTWLQQQVFNSPATNFIMPFTTAIGDQIIYKNSLDFNSRVCRQYFLPTLNQIVQQNLIPVFSFERLSGHPFSGGYDSKEIADRLHQTFPEAQILIVIRKQQDAIRSMYNQYIKNGGFGDIKKFIFPPHRSGRLPYFNLDHYCYHRLIDYYYNIFGKKRVLVLPFEMLQQQPQIFLDQITKFANGQIKQSISFQPINSSQPIIINSLKRRLNYLLPQTKSSHSITPSLAIKASQRRFWNAINQFIPQKIKGRLAINFNHKLNQLISGYFINSNHQTSSLSGLDLKKYLYDL